MHTHAHVWVEWSFTFGHTLLLQLFVLHSFNHCFMLCFIITYSFNHFWGSTTCEILSYTQEMTTWFHITNSLQFGLRARQVRRNPANDHSKHFIECYWGSAHSMWIMVLNSHKNLKQRYYQAPFHMKNWAIRLVRKEMCPFGLGTVSESLFVDITEC